MILINFEYNVNIINPSYAAKLYFQIKKINVNAQKIDGSFLENYSIVIAAF